MVDRHHQPSDSGPCLTLEKFAMKKTLIALAVLTVSSASFAQSSVTLFGRIDASIGTNKVTSTTNGVTSTADNGTEMYSGNLVGSRWGVRGTEDLGGGLSAVFHLESSFNIDTGAEGTSSGLTGGFNRNAFVGLSGGFGTVHLGRSYTAFDDAKALSVSSSVFDSNFTPVGTPAYTIRGANQIKYVSPTLFGFNAIVTSALKESKAVGAKDTNGVTLGYADGPIKAALGLQKDAAGDNVIISGAYDLGVASISAGYSTLDGINNGNDSKGLNLGVNVPMGALNFSLGYGAGKTETNGGVKVSEYSGYGVGVTYALSKRTRVYAGYKDEKTENAAGVKTFGSKLTAAGVRHDF